MEIYAGNMRRYGIMKVQVILEHKVQSGGGGVIHGRHIVPFKCFHRTAVPHLRLLLILFMMPLKRFVTTEIDLRALLKN